MKYTMTVSPDFRPSQIAEWYILNTWLQHQLDMSIHLEIFNNFADQRKAIEKNQIDFIYANPFDASTLVRDKGFEAILKPVDRSDEAIIAVSADSDIEHVSDIPSGINIAQTDYPDINHIGMIMLEPADLNAENTTPMVQDNFAIVAKQVLNGKATVGIFLTDAFDDFSGLLQRQLRVLVRSQISVISHAFMVSPKASEHIEAVRTTLIGMSNNPSMQDVLAGLGFSGWETQSHEDTEFMIDVMDTLVS